MGWPRDSPWVCAVKGMAVAGTDRWQVEAGALPCVVERASDGWVVTIAACTVSRNRGLVPAILEAGGGIVTRTEAERIARFVLTSPAQSSRRGTRGPRPASQSLDR